MNSTPVGLDGNALRGLQARAASTPRAAIVETARQLESLFMQELLKSMRQATLASGMLDNAGTKMGTELLDAQFAQKLTGLPNGLGAMIARQLERQVATNATSDAQAQAASVHGATTSATPQAALLPGVAAGAPRAAATAGRIAIGANPTASPATQVWNRLPGATAARDFVARNSAAAERAAAATGIPAVFILSQAAHESGWGRHQIRMADGRSSHNVFGIKAGADWKGPVAEVTTTEYVGGQPRKVVARFRAYASVEASFRDYAELIKSSPRYAKVVEQGGTARGFAVNLQRAGYATDPAYAAKLGRVIDTTLRLQREPQT